MLNGREPRRNEPHARACSSQSRNFCLFSSRSPVSTVVSSSYRRGLCPYSRWRTEKDYAFEGNFVLQDLIANGQAMKTVSLPRRRQRLHAMPTSAGYEIRENEAYDWDGRRRGQTPFTVLQHTI